MPQLLRGHLLIALVALLASPQLAEAGHGCTTSTLPVGRGSVQSL